MNAADSPRSSSSRPLLLLVLVGGLACAGWWFFGRCPACSPAPKGAEGPATHSAHAGPPPVAFLNANTSAAYVGGEVCRACHKELTEHHGTTPHGRSFGTVDPSTEHLPGKFKHALSGMSYEMYEKDGRMRMRESFRLEDGTSAQLADFEMKYFIGSGSHSRTYAFEDNGFLVEAPATYYTSLDAWAVSPGYDQPRHFGFSRALPGVCIACHAGRVEVLDGSLHRLRVHEEAIGCESCHGAGGLHVAYWQEHDQPLEGIDHTIVNPKHLTAEQSMDLCGKCHMPVDMAVTRPGKNVSNWRPGQLLTDYRVRFREAGPDDAMTLEGHPDQLKHSRCYKASGTLSCITCHNSHERPDPEERVAYYEAKCQSCHGPDACGVDPAHQDAHIAANDCVACHMPRSDTNIPHIAFNHHRIGIHPPAGDAKPTPPPPPSDGVSLIPIDDVSGWSQDERERNQGLAYARLSEARMSTPQGHGLRLQALKILEDLSERGVSDPDADAVLAIMGWRKDAERSLALALSVLATDKPTLVSSRLRALTLALQARNADQDKEEAERLLEVLKTVRRSHDDYLWLASKARAEGNKEAALEAALAALAITPQDPNVQWYVAETYEWLGDAKRAKEHNTIAQELNRKQGRGRR